MNTCISFHHEKWREISSSLSSSTVHYLKPVLAVHLDLYRRVSLRTVRDSQVRTETNHLRRPSLFLSEILTVMIKASIMG
jgi:hypothetical protein